MKHYINIQALKEEDVIFNGEITRYRNDTSFKKGDRIVIAEKIDGSNASITLEDGVIKSFSHKKELDYQNTLNGFYNFVETRKNELETFFNIYDDELIIFGEWTACRNKLVYDEKNKGKLYLFDVYDKTTERWLNYDEFLYVFESLKAEMPDDLIDIVHVLYDGEFISWEHCKSFMNSPYYGECQEGIVVRNISALARNVDEDGREPWILKIVNDNFKESMIKVPKEIDPEKEAAKQSAQELMSQIITRARVEKILIKLQNEDNVLPQVLCPKDMGLVARNLPKAVYEDLVKEEPEIVKACGEYGGKIANQLTMNIARQILL